MRPRKDVMQAIESDGSLERLNQLLSASHLLLCQANNLVEEASDLMTERGLMIGLLKKRHNDLTRVADAYFKEFASMITTDKSKMDMFSDMEDFETKFRKWAKIPADWKPNETPE